MPSTKETLEIIDYLLNKFPTITKDLSDSLSQYLIKRYGYERVKQIDISLEVIKKEKTTEYIFSVGEEKIGLATTN